jgi:YVTN family beta-propeller protein
MKSLLIRKKTWLLVALLLITTSCTVTTCRVGNTLIYYYDFQTRWDAFSYNIFDAENSLTGALSLYPAPYGTATGVSILAGTPALGITSYYSGANLGAQGVYFHTSNALYWMNGTNQNLLGSLPVTPSLRDFQIAPNGNFALGTDGASGNIYDFGLNPLKLNYTYNFGSAATLNRLAISQDSSEAIITDYKLGAFYKFNPVMKTYQPMTIPFSSLGKPAFNRDGLSYAIPFGGSNPGVAFYDTLTDTPITTTVGIPYPTELTTNLTGTKLYVLSSPPTGNGSVFWINPDNFNVGGNVTVGSGPIGFAWSPGGTMLYTANSGDGTLSVIGTTGKPSVLTTVTVGTNPDGVATSPLSPPYTP